MVERGKRCPHCSIAALLPGVGHCDDACHPENMDVRFVHAEAIATLAAGQFAAHQHRFARQPTPRDFILSGVRMMLQVAAGDIEYIAELAAAMLRHDDEIGLATRVADGCEVQGCSHTPSAHATDMLRYIDRTADAIEASRAEALAEAEEQRREGVRAAVIDKLDAEGADANVRRVIRNLENAPERGE